MSSKTEICNKAISHLGIGKEIVNFETEKSEEARACRRFFDDTMEIFQRDFNYPFATKRKVLGLVREDPNEQYSYEYEYPSDCQFAGRIISGLIKDNRQSQVQYQIVRGENGPVIHSNWEEAELEYQFMETDAGRYKADFVLAFSYKLAELIAPRIAAGDPFGLGPRAAQNYIIQKNKAQANALNEQQEEEEPQSEFVRVMNADTIRGNAVDWYPTSGGWTIL